MRFIQMLIITLLWLPAVCLAGSTQEVPPDDCLRGVKPKQVFFNDCMRANEDATAFYMDRHGDSDPGKRALLPQRLILGLSKRDFATNKVGLVPCGWKGATCMAVKIKESCKEIAEDLRIAPPQLLAVNFAKQGLWHPHEVKAYMKDDEWSELTRALLAADPGTPAATPTLCAARVSGAS